MRANRRLRLAFSCVWLLPAAVGAVPEVEADEVVVLFDTAAHASGEGDAIEWIAPVHGWIYEPEDSRLRKATLAAGLRAKFGLEVSDLTRANFDRRANLFFSDNERGKRITVRAGSAKETLPASTPNGHFHGELRVGAQEAAAALRKDGAIDLRVVLDRGDARGFGGTVHLVPRRGISVVSDIDDTVKLSEVADRRALLDSTFFQDFRAARGMAAKYREWASRGAAFHFVSSSPWQLYVPLREFLHAAGFPPAVLELKSVRFKDETLLDLFKPGSETKPRQIEPILARFPERRFVLVGDSGEHDPEVYSALYRAHPEQVARIYIRNVSDARPDDARFGALFAGIPAERWALFTDPADLGWPEAD